MFKTVWDLVIVIIITGLVSTFEIGLVGSVIGKIIESKLKTHYQMEMKYYELIMSSFDSTVEKFFNRIDGTIEKTKGQQEEPKKIGF